MRKSRKNFNLKVLVVLLGLVFLVFTFYYREGAKGFTHQFQNSLSTALFYLLTPFSWAREQLSTFKEGVVTYRTLKARNQLLEKENKNFKVMATRFLELESENRRLKSLLGFKEKFAYRTIAAKVVGYSPREDEAVIIINRGIKDKVREGMAVMVPEGLVGKVEKVYFSFSLVRLLIDRDFGLSVRVVQTRETCVLTADEKRNLHVRFLSLRSPVKRGDDVVTSGFSRLIPKGIFVGKVGEVYKRSGSLEKEVLVYSNVSFDRLEEVLVVLD